MPLLKQLLSSIIMLASLISYAQNDCISCYNILNQVDRILSEKDTATAIYIFESLDEKVCPIRKGRYLHYSKIYLDLGDLDRSKEMMQKAVEKGILGSIFYGQNLDRILKIIEERYGLDFLNQMITLNQTLFEKNQKEYGAITKILKEVYDSDQALRKEERYKTPRNYDFRYRLGFPYDSTLNHQEMMDLNVEFRQKDSTILQAFVDIVYELGYVPGDDITFGGFPVSPVVNHTSHFDYKNLDSLYLHSVKIGTLSPIVYAWYQGYHEEYFKEAHQLYFSHGEKAVKALEPEKIEIINARRRAIGLPLCPAVIWNTRRY